MRLAAVLLALLLASGCVVIYAPSAERAAIQIHDQTASNLTNNATVPIEPRLANEVTGAVGIKGDVGSKNTIASPSVNAKLK